MHTEFLPSSSVVGGVLPVGNRLLQRRTILRRYFPKTIGYRAFYLIDGPNGSSFD
jgi:hypothetical protein